VLWWGGFALKRKRPKKVIALSMYLSLLSLAPSLTRVDDVHPVFRLS